MKPRFAGWAAVLVLMASGCAAGDTVRLDSAPEATAVPPARATLAEVGWPEAAAWMSRSIENTDQPVVVKFFASWCLPCRDEAPVLLDAAAAHDDVVFVGVAHQDRHADAAAFIDEYGLDAIPTLFDPLGEVVRAVGGRSMPATAFVDRHGVVQYTHSGPLEHELLEAWVDHLAADGPRPEPTADRDEAAAAR